MAFDLAAAKLAHSLKWSYPDKYADVFIHLGEFHTVCCYMAALGSMMADSGFEDLVIESGICASGSTAQVMNGKHYNQALRVHSIMADAVSRLLLQAFVEQAGTDVTTLPELVDISAFPDPERLITVTGSESCQRLIKQLVDFVDQVHAGVLGTTAQFWISYYDCVCSLVLFQQSVKRNDLSLYTDCLQ